MTGCTIRQLVLTQLVGWLAGGAILFGTIGHAVAASRGVGTLVQENDRAAVVFMARPATVLKSDFARMSGMSQNRNSPENLLLSESETVRGVLMFPDDFTQMLNGPGMPAFDFYLEFKLNAEAQQSRFREFVVERGELVKEEDDAAFYRLGRDTPFEIVFDGDLVTLVSSNCKYDPSRLPEMTKQSSNLLEKYERSDAVLVVDAQGIERTIVTGVQFGMENLPDDAKPFLEILERVNWATVVLVADETATLTIQSECLTTNDADKLSDLVDELVATAKARNDAMGPAGEVNSKLLESIKTKVKGQNVETVITFSEEMAEQSKLAAAEVELMNNQKQVVLSMHNAMDAFKKFPFQTPPGQSENLSWRVRVLPFLDQGELYKRFDLTKSWDSPENVALAMEMPRLFGDGEQTNLCWVKSDVQTFADITNGTSNTIAFIHSDKFVNWTENNDVTPADVMEQFRKLKPGGYLIASMYDGSVRKIPAETDPVEFEAMLYPKPKD